MSGSILTSGQLKRLRDAMVDTLSDGALEDLLLFELGKPIDQIEGRSDSTKHLVRAVILAAQREGWLPQLVEATANARKNNAELQALRDEVWKNKERSSEVGESSKPRIYVSHHAVDEPARRFLEQLKTALAPRSYEILSHEGCILPRTHNASLHVALGKAHAAVLLLSRSALACDLFRIELSIMAARQVVQPFRLVPVLVDVTVEELEQNQFVPWDVGVVLRDALSMGSNSAEQVVQAVVEQLGDLAELALPQTSLEKVERDIMAYLRDVDEQAVVNVAGRLGVPMRAALSPDERRALLAGVLWHTRAQEWAPVLHALFPKGTGSIDRESFAELIFPSWVDPYSAQWLVAMGRDDAAQRAVALNAEEAEFVGRSFVRRAYCLPPGEEWVVVAPIADGASPGSHADGIRKILRKSVPGLNYDDPKRFESALRNKLHQQPIFVVIPPPVPPKKVIGALLKEFKRQRLVFLLLTATPVAAGLEPGDVLLENILSIRPELAEAEDLDAYLAYTELRGEVP